MATAQVRDKALAEINALAPELRVAAIQKLVEKRREKTFVRYFKPWEPDQNNALKKFTGDIKIFGLLGGNRSGKTVLGAFIAVAWALGKEYFRDEPAWEYVKELPIPEGPKNIWVVGLDFGVLRDVIWYEKLRHGKSHPPFLPDDGSITKITDGDYQVFFRNGSIITGKSADSGREKFQGASVDLVWIDEECEEDIFNECYQRTIDCAGHIILTLTPLIDINSGARTPWVFDLYQEFMSGNKDLAFANLSTIESPYVSPEEKTKLKEKWAGDPEEGARLYGKFVRRSGLVYPLWDPTKHIIKPFKVPKHWQRVVSIDPAATSVTAALWVAIDEEGNYYGFHEYYERDKTVSQHARGIKIHCGGEPVDIWLLDPKWGTQRNAESHKTGEQLYRDAGIPVRLPIVGEDFGLLVSKEYIAATVTANSRNPKFYLFRGCCPSFEDEIAHYTYDSYTKGPLRGTSKEKPRKRNDHLMNAFQYACALRLKGKSVDKRRIKTELEDLEERDILAEKGDAVRRNYSYT